MDSPLSNPARDCPNGSDDDVFPASSRSWDLAYEACVTPTLEDQEIEMGAWANDLQSVLHEVSTSFPVFNPPGFFSSSYTVPPLYSYHSDDSPDNTPASSDVEDSPKAVYNGKAEKKKKRTTKRGLTSIFTPSPLISTGTSKTVFSVNKQQENEADLEDEFVKLALLEDTKEFKTKAFPELVSQAKSIISKEVVGSKNSMESIGINALLSAFTKDDKTGRPLPHACQQLLQMATDEVAQARKKQKETKVTRKTTCIVQNQLENAVFVCGAPDCKKKYTTAEGLRLHIRNHHDVDKKWICHSPECTAERAFVRQADLRMHLIRMHSPVRPFPCRVPDCPKTFACHSELRRHIATEHIELVRQLIRENKPERSKLMETEFEQETPNGILSIQESDQREKTPKVGSKHDDQEEEEGDVETEVEDEDDEEYKPKVLKSLKRSKSKVVKAKRTKLTRRSESVIDEEPIKVQETVDDETN